MEVVNRNSAETFITKDSSLIKEILAPGNSSLMNQSLAEATVEKGRSTEEHYHSHAEEIYYVLRGSGRIAIGGESRNISAGDAVAILPGKRHKVWNASNDDLVFLCCCAPAYTHEDTIITE